MKDQSLTSSNELLSTMDLCRLDDLMSRCAGGGGGGGGDRLDDGMSGGGRWRGQMMNQRKDHSH